jgi:hypothetical protein
MVVCSILTGCCERTNLRIKDGDSLTQPCQYEDALVMFAQREDYQTLPPAVHTDKKGDKQADAAARQRIQLVTIENYCSGSGSSGLNMGVHKRRLGRNIQLAMHADDAGGRAD